MSAVLEQKGDDNKSLKYQIEAKEMYSQSGNKFFEAITLRSIGIKYEKIGKLDKAMEYYMRIINNYTNSIYFHTIN